MSYQFRSSPIHFNPLDLPNLKGWEGITPDGKRIQVFISGDKYVVQYPDAKDMKGESKPLGFTMSRDGIFVLTALLAQMQGIDIGDTENYYTEV